MVKCIDTVCGMCNNVCGMKVYVHDGRIVRVEGLAGHIASGGELCPKALAAVEYEYDPNRLRKPLRREGERGKGKWREISWNEALDTIASKLW